MSRAKKYVFAAFMLILFCAGYGLAQEHAGHDISAPGNVLPLHAGPVAQVVALDECDPATFNQALGPDFCHNVALGFSTTLADLFAKAAAGTPDANWDFEPDALRIKEGT